MYGIKTSFMPSSCQHWWRPYPIGSAPGVGTVSQSPFCIHAGLDRQLTVGLFTKIPRTLRKRRLWPALQMVLNALQSLPRSFTGPGWRCGNGNGTSSASPLSHQPNFCFMFHKLMLCWPRSFDPRSGGALVRRHPTEVEAKTTL